MFLALTFVLAPLPNALFSRCGGDDFSTEYDGSGPVDLGRFITASVVVTGFALPLVLAHSEVITRGACVMSIAGGAYVSDNISCVSPLTFPQSCIWHHPSVQSDLQGRVRL